MDIGAEAGSNQDWRSPENYTPMLAYGRRALAWQCLCRDRNFLETVQSAMPTSIEIWREEPPIIVVTLSDEDRLASWGVYFRPLPTTGDGGRLCRLAS